MKRVAVAVGLVVLAGCASAGGVFPVTVGSTVTPSTTSTSSVPSGTSTTTVPSTTSAAPAPCTMVGYSRAQFGNQPSTKVRSDLLAARKLPGGGWTDAYTLATVTVSSTLDVDHRVSLGEAWTAGACRWTLAQRIGFAKDPSNLALTVAHVNRAKGDLGPDAWRPPNPAACADYLVAYRQIRTTYNLLPYSAATLAGLAKGCTP